MGYKFFTARCALAVTTSWLCISSASAAPLADTDWPSYNNTANGQRYSTLDQITTANVAQLSEVCRLKVDDSGTFQPGMLEIEGVLYFTTGHDTLAIDARTCAEHWRHVYRSEQQDVAPNNRGVAYANGKLFRGTPDARLIALDAATGKLLWKQQVGDPQQGEFFSSVPAVWQSTLIAGAAGSDWGIRGRIMAYDQNSGNELWRFYTIPRGKEVGAETWTDRNSARYGGGGSWSTYTLDMASGEVFVPVGNPAPDFMPGHRPGANLFTNSAVVLDARSGALKWWHQMTPSDGLDLDIAAAPLLYWNSKGEAMLAIGSKDGHVYGVNRETHARIFKTAVTTIVKADRLPDAKGVRACPGALGGVEWNGPAYDHKHKQIVVGSVDWCSVFKSDTVKYEPGNFLFGGSYSFDDSRSGWIMALNPDDGAVRWRYHADGPVAAGITPTAGGLVLTGDMNGNLLALDAANGSVLLKRPTGGALAGGVITYALNGRQYVAIASGNVSSRLSFGESGKPTVIVYALGDGTTPTTAPPVALASGGVDPASIAQSAADGGRGRELYAQNCAACHGANGEGAVGPKLQGLQVRRDYAATIKWITAPSAKMPKLYPSTLDGQAVADIAAFVQGL
jgi:alcohol dehydrogenase (cytochrome c)